MLLCKSLPQQEAFLIKSPELADVFLHPSDDDRLLRPDDEYFPLLLQFVYQVELSVI